MRSVLRILGLVLTFAAIGCAPTPETPELPRNWLATVKVKVTLEIDGEAAVASACGVVIWEDGLVLTNKHVVNDAKTIAVMHESAKSDLPATVIATSDADLALLRVAHRFPTAARIADAKDAKPGDPLYGVTVYGRVGKIVIRGAIARTHFTLGLGESSEELKAAARRLDLDGDDVDVLLVDYAGSVGSSGSGLYRKRDDALIGINSFSLLAAGSASESIFLRGVIPGYKIIKFLDTAKVPYHPARTKKRSF
ncbi:MAG: serine protease [Patescibacteria group bacterium]